MTYQGKHTGLSEGDKLNVLEIPHIGFHVTVEREDDRLDFPNAPDNKKIVYGSLDDFKANIRDFNCLELEEASVSEGAEAGSKAYKLVSVVKPENKKLASSKL